MSNQNSILITQPRQPLDAATDMTIAFIQLHKVLPETDTIVNFFQKMFKAAYKMQFHSSSSIEKDLQKIDSVSER